MRIRNGQVVDDDGGILERIIAAFWALVNGISFFIQTLISPDATGQYKQYGSKKGWGNDKNNKRGPGGGGPGGGGPRISGMSNLPGSNNPPCGPGGG